ncbi:hypothetical protein P3G55_02325 [Leptospira sp. 96542]|nr:hypothetical protein [Leptospira sp. 96542]
MGKGYHSKSPEEFRNYLKEIGKENKKSRWRQIVMIIDLVLIILIFYLGFKALNPGSFSDRSQSQKQVVDGYPVYLSLSREEDDAYQGYFLFIENQTKDLIVMPKPNWEMEFRITTRDGNLCHSEIPEFEQRKIPNNAKGFLYHSISKTKLWNLNEVCRKEIFDEDASIFRSKFKSLDLGFYAQMIIQTENRRYVFPIKQKPFKKP